MPIWSFSVDVLFFQYTILYSLFQYLNAKTMMPIFLKCILHFKMLSVLESLSPSLSSSSLWISMLIGKFVCCTGLYWDPNDAFHNVHCWEPNIYTTTIVVPPGQSLLAVPWQQRKIKMAVNVDGWYKKHVSSKCINTDNKQADIILHQKL